MVSPALASTAMRLPAEFAQALRELGLAGPDEALTGEPLTGGVSSDIWRVDAARGPICAKRALPKLRVAADWQAPIERNQYEARWMRVAQAAVPGAAPRVLGQHAALGVLAMEYLPTVSGGTDGNEGKEGTSAAHRLWKDQLRCGVAEVATARAVGDTLVRIHAHSAARAGELAGQFDTDRIFFEIRLAPYLLATAERHADLAPALRALVAQTQANKLALVHGDVSPKNILVAIAKGPVAKGPVAKGPVAKGPVLLDAECAWWGDPAFDLAFCLNHLLLKGLWVPAARTELAACFDALATAYLAGVAWEPPAALERRAAALLPGLLLARVDGKSPVEYLDQPAQREAVRRVARPLLARPVPLLSEVQQAWQRELESE